MAIRNPNLDEEIITYDKLQTDELNDVKDSVALHTNEINGIKNINVPKLRLLTGTCTGSSTTVTFPTGWDNPAVLSVEIRNANNVWVTINARYASNSGLNFYFTHDAGFAGLEYRVNILKTQNLGG